MKNVVGCAQVRHGESWGNIDEKAYEKNPDSQIELTARGMQQAIDTGARIHTHPPHISRRLLATARLSVPAAAAGKRIREIIGDEGEVYFYVSPYRRALQTLLCLGKRVAPAPPARPHARCARDAGH